MVHGRLDYIKGNGVNIDAVSKLDSWLGELPEDYAGTISPLVFARQAKLDTRVAAEIFNYACRQKVLRLEFEVVCPMCGRCVGRLGANGVHEHCNNCSMVDECCGANGKQLRIAYHLNSPVYN